MRYGVIFGVLAMAMAMTALGAAARPGSALWPVEIFDVMDGQRLVVFLHNEDIAASPVWQPTEGGPPLTIAETLGHVEDWIAKDPRLAGAEIREIELKPIHEHEMEHRWYYLVQLHGVQNGRSKAFYAAVLFTGKVVPAIAEPASIK